MNPYSNDSKKFKDVGIETPTSNNVENSQIQFH